MDGERAPLDALADDGILDQLFGQLAQLGRATHQATT
jgi:hypothetical protein